MYELKNQTGFQLIRVWIQLKNIYRFFFFFYRTRPFGSARDVNLEVRPLSRRIIIIVVGTVHLVRVPKNDFSIFLPSRTDGYRVNSTALQSKCKQHLRLDFEHF